MNLAQAKELDSADIISVLSILNTLSDKKKKIQLSKTNFKKPDLVLDGTTYRAVNVAHYLLTLPKYIKSLQSIEVLMEV